MRFVRVLGLDSWPRDYSVTADRKPQESGRRTLLSEGGCGEATYRFRDSGRHSGDDLSLLRRRRQPIVTFGCPRVNKLDGHLNVRRYGADGSPVMMLHGFTLTGAMFEPVADRTTLSVHAPDLPGHGKTTVHPTFPETVKSLADYLRDFGPMPVVGYSLGGRIGVQVAIEHPELVPLLILISASFGIQDVQERADRAAREIALAKSIRAGSIEGFVDRWLTHPVAAPCGLDDATKAWDRSVRLENTSDGLAEALQGLGQGEQEWLGDAAQSLPMHIITVTGSRDAKYSSLAAAWCAAADPDGPSRCHVVVPRAGHNLIVEQPDHVAPLIENLVKSDSP